MRNPRIHVDIPLATTVSQKITLDTHASNHLLKVLRLRPGASIRLFDGDGHDYQAQLSRIEKKRAVVEISSRTLTETPASMPVSLGLALSKGERMDFAIQKSVELGINHIDLLETDFNALKLGTERMQKRFRHWQAVLIAACEQSGRSRIPELTFPQALPAWLKSGFTGTRILLNPLAKKKLPEISQPHAVQLLVGPEGGLSDTEIELATNSGFENIRLGKPVLRTETAPLAAIAAIQVLWGDFR